MNAPEPVPSDKEIMLAARRIHFSDHVPEGRAFVIKVPDMTAIPTIIRDQPEWPTVLTLIVNPKTLGLAPNSKERP